MQTILHQHDYDDMARERNKAIRLQRAARAWWSGRRPIGWSLKRHLLDPTINCTDDYEKLIAKVVAQTYKKS